MRRKRVGWKKRRTSHLALNDGWKKRTAEERGDERGNKGVVDGTFDTRHTSGIQSP